MVTAREVAKLAGVSQATVSRVLHEHSSVSERTKSRVRGVLADTGYEPNVAARTMRTNRTGTIGLIVDDVANPFYPQLIGAIGRALEQAGTRMILWDSAGPGESAALAAIDQKLVDGLIFTTATTDSRPLARAIHHHSPVVLVNRTVDGLPCDQVDSDNRSGAACVARYFASHGHQRVGLISGSQWASTARHRETGFRSGCHEYGLELPDASVANGLLSHHGGRAAMERIMEQSGPCRPSAVFCTNDLSALGAIDALTAWGSTAPDDLWLVGYDDIAMAAWETFGLSTVRQPLADMAEAAVTLLLRRIANSRRAIVHKRFRNEIVARGTTAHRETVDD